MTMEQEALSEEHEDYLLDLRGYRLLRNAVSQPEVDELLRWIDDSGVHARSQVGRWVGGETPSSVGNVELHSYYTAPDGSNPSGVDDGINLQHIYEGGDCWERLLDHPSWCDTAPIKPLAPRLTPRVQVAAGPEVPGCGAALETD